jgi:hypothetical protein
MTLSTLIESLPLLATLLVSATSIGLLISRDWRWNIALLGIQYIGIALFTSFSWPLEMAITKMVAGWMSSAVLGMAMASISTAWGGEENFLPSGRAFRLLAAILISVAVLSAVPTLSDFFPRVSDPTLIGGLVLISMGLLHLGLTAQPLRISIGLLTLLAGFEVIYASVESSILVAGLLAGVNIAIGVIGAYMITVSEMEQEYE